MVLANRAALVELQARVDALMGYPKTGRKADTGALVPGNVTPTHALVEQHPNGTDWCYEVDALSRAHVQAVRAACQALGGAGTPREQAIAAMPAERDRTSDWETPPPAPTRER